jgi:hypothetical protein
MKKSSLIFNSILLLLVISSCSNDNGPKQTAFKFLTAFNERNFTEARTYSTPETGKLVDLMENISKMAQDKDSATAKKVEILDEKINGETALVTFREEGSEATQEVKLKKINGKWLVHVTKEDIAAKDVPQGGEEEEAIIEEDSTFSDTTSVE